MLRVARTLSLVVAGSIGVGLMTGYHVTAAIDPLPIEKLYPREPVDELVDVARTTYPEDMTAAVRPVAWSDPRPSAEDLDAEFGGEIERIANEDSAPDAPLAEPTSTEEDIT